MSAGPRIPLPRPTALSRPHWDACRAGRLLVQRCADCGAHVFVPEPLCTRCTGARLEWVESAGRGAVYSFSIVHRPPRPEFAVPYVVAIVALDEGFFMLTNLVECAPADVAIGLRVEVAFRRMSEEITLPCFRPLRAAP